ncbi:MAG: hypothetical protein JOY67_09670 [Hyphomicrobiales bacterium]|nr:hypothetical protein [Hyphomicrobiales bacterium]MBV9113078.1 hypothetical protein [Hyphomicrobiales bacterium]MBV9517653.1 hypothetical protein [Hyphomicrobiales bacterium]
MSRGEAALGAPAFTGAEGVGSTVRGIAASCDAASTGGVLTTSFMGATGVGANICGGLAVLPAGEVPTAGADGSL